MLITSRFVLSFVTSSLLLAWYIQIFLKIFRFFLERLPMISSFFFVVARNSQIWNNFPMFLYFAADTLDHNITKKHLIGCRAVWKIKTMTIITNSIFFLSIRFLLFLFHFTHTHALYTFSNNTLITVTSTVICLVFINSNTRLKENENKTKWEDKKSKSGAKMKQNNGEKKTFGLH